MILLALAVALGPWLTPIPGAEVIQEFAPALHSWVAGHRGVDFAAQPGAQVHAIGPGVVSFVGTIAGKPVISIEHPGLGLRSTYEPVVPALQEGQLVTAGQAIGTVADRGGHCGGICLHLGLKGSGRNDYRNPLTLFGSGAAVLKPLTD